MSSGIHFYFDFISPYGYLAATQISRLEQELDEKIHWHPYLLSIAVTQAMKLPPMMQIPLKSQYVIEDLPRLAKAVDVPLEFPSNPAPHPLASARAFYWTQQNISVHKAEELALRLLSHQWAEQGDISSPDIVAEQARIIGIDPNDLLEGIQADTVKNNLRTETDKAIEKGIFGSPFFDAYGEKFWGVDRLWMLKQWVTKREWTPSPEHF